MDFSFKTNYKDYSNYIAIMISSDRNIFVENSNVRNRMIEEAKKYRELHIIVYSTKNIQQFGFENNYKIYSTNSIHKIFYMFDAYRIGKKIIGQYDTKQPILVTCQNAFEIGIVGYLLSKKRKNIELLLQLHTEIFSTNYIKHSCINRLRSYVSKIILSKAQTIRVVSENIAKSVVNIGIDKERIIIKPVEINIEKIRNTESSFNLHEKFPQFKKNVLMVSRLEREKNIEMALEAWKIIIDSNKNYGLIIVGSGSELNKLKSLVNKLKLDKQVIFEGWQSDLVSYYKTCDVFLLTSWYEGYGMVLKEAQASKCRIVSTDVGIARDIGAEIVEWNPINIAKKLINILNDK